MKVSADDLLITVIHTWYVLGFVVCKQQDFPKKLPMSQSVPQIYTQVKEFIYASLKFSESLHRRFVPEQSIHTDALSF